MRKLVSILLIAQLTATIALAQQTPHKVRKPAARPAQAGAGQAAPARMEGPPEPIKPPPGPMRVEPFNIIETRIRNLRNGGTLASRSNLRFQVLITGERLGEVVGLGNLIIEYMADDTGQVLASLDDYPESEREATSPIRISKRMLKRGLVQRVSEAKLPSRKATKLTEVRGWVNLVYATETEEIMIDNPLQYLGGYIEHPRLAELGLKIEVVKPDENIVKRAQRKGIALRFSDNLKHVRKVEFFDAWLKPLYPRQHNINPENGKPYIFYEPMVGQIDTDTQMLLTIYPKIEEQKLRFEFKDIELP